MFLRLSIPNEEKSHQLARRHLIVFLSLSLDHKYFAIFIRLFHYGWPRRYSSPTSLTQRDSRQQRKEIVNFELIYFENRPLVSEIS